MEKEKINADVLFRNASELTNIFSNPVSNWDVRTMEVLEYKLDYIRLFFPSRRLYLALLKNGLNNSTTLAEIIRMGRQYFSCIPKFGKKGIEALEEMMDAFDVDWNTDVELYELKKFVMKHNGVKIINILL